MKRFMITMLILAVLLLAIQAPLMARSFTNGQTGTVCMTDGDEGATEQPADPNAGGGVETPE
jgi:hypothetical protein